MSRDGILEQGFESRFLGILLILEFLSGCPLIFPFYKMLFMNRLEFSFMFSECRVHVHTGEVELTLKVHKREIF